MVMQVSMVLNDFSVASNGWTIDGSQWFSMPLNGSLPGRPDEFVEKTPKPFFSKSMLSLSME
jgi:hypothetical protein